MSPYLNCNRGNSKKGIIANERIQTVRTLKITTFWATYPIVQVSLLFIRSNHPLWMGVQSLYCSLFCLFLLDQQFWQGLYVLNWFFLANEQYKTSNKTISKWLKKDIPAESFCSRTDDSQDNLVDIFRDHSIGG